MSPKLITIGLLWHSANSDNLGVGALTTANMALAREVAQGMGLKPRFVIIGMREKGRSYVADVEARVFAVDTLRLLSPSGCWSLFGKLDCILDIGGGDSFTEIYGARRFFFIWMTKLIALLRRTPLLFSPQTIGPFTHALYRRLARFALNRAFSVVARDQISFDALRELAPAAKAVLSTDVAFALPYVDNSARRGGERLKVGVNISGLMFNEAALGRKRFDLDFNYAELMRAFVGQLASRPEIEVHLLAHVTGSPPGPEDDGPAVDSVAREFPSTVRAPSFASPSEAKSYISGLDFLVSGRMHACIAAYSSGTPVTPIAYSRKFAGLFGTLDYPWLVPAKGCDTSQALAYLENCLARRGELAGDVGRGQYRVKTLLDAYASELRAFFAASVGGR